MSSAGSDAAELTVNGVPVRLAPEDGQLTLQALLHGRLRLTEVRYGCGEGVCGACTVLLDGRAVPSCLVPAARAVDRAVLTASGLASADGPWRAPAERLRAQFAGRHAFQCGYCSSGMLVATAHLLASRTGPLDRAAVAEGLSGNLCRCTGYTAILDAVAAASAGAPAPEVSRPDLLDKMDGRVAYPTERPAGALVCGVLTAAQPAARILAVDTAPARGIEGVAAVLIADALPGANACGNDVFARDQRLLADGEVYTTSDAVALVAAESEPALDAALGAIRVDYAPRAPVSELDDALAGRRVMRGRSNVVGQFHQRRGDATRVFAAAETVVEEVFRCGPAEHVCLEPDGGSACWDGETLVITVPSQTPYGARRLAARVAGLPVERVRVRAPRTGGAFGRHMVGGGTKRTLPPSPSSPDATSGSGPRAARRWRRGRNATPSAACTAQPSATDGSSPSRRTSWRTPART